MRLPAVLVTAALLTLPVSALAQGPELRIPDLSHLKSKAVETVDVSIGPMLLNFASRLMPEDDADSRQAKELLTRIDRITVRSYEFSDDNAYSKADVESVLKQLAGPQWTPIVQVHKQGDREDTDIYVCIENDRATGFAVIAREARELTIVNVVGSIELQQLGQLQGQMGIPQFGAD